MTNVERAEVPLKVYKSEDRLTVASPMPGLEPQDINITVDNNRRLTLYGELRGTLKGEKDVILNEWNPGPYRRSFEMSVNVDASAANATYENGILVVSLPISGSTTPATITLDRIGPTEGLHKGNEGHPARS
jgi:HSP20 family protein